MADNLVHLLILILVVMILGDVFYKVARAVAEVILDIFGFLCSLFRKKKPETEPDPPASDVIPMRLGQVHIAANGERVLIDISEEDLPRVAEIVSAELKRIRKNPIIKWNGEP